MSKTLMTLLAAALMAGAVQAAPVITPAVDPDRPAADVARDALRKPARMLAFAGVKPGDTVIELLPGGGYFTRLLSRAVGPSGHVYAAIPDAKSTDAEPAAAAIAALPAYANVTVIPITGLAAAPTADVIWMAQNYHDMHLSRLHVDVSGFNKLLFARLKSGGVLMLIDHVAATGAPVTETADRLHRIDPAVARGEIVNAGFVFEDEAADLRNPNDAHTALVFDPAIRGHTDQFVYRFRKP